MTSDQHLLVYVLGVLILAPVLVYYCVKFGTLGFIRAYQLIRSENEARFQELVNPCQPDEKKSGSKFGTPTPKR